MVHGNAIRIYYGYAITKKLFETLSEELLMKYMPMFIEILNGREYSHIIGVEITIDYQKIHGISTEVKEIEYIDKKDLQELVEKSSEKIQLKDIKKLVVTDYEYPNADKFAEIYSKTMSYKDDYHKYIGLTKIEFSDIEKYVEKNSFDLTVKLAEKIISIPDAVKEKIVVITPEFLVYVYGY
jgi:hypothetical protein